MKTSWLLTRVEHAAAGGAEQWTPQNNICKWSDLQASNKILVTIGSLLLFARYMTSKQVIFLSVEFILFQRLS